MPEKRKRLRNFFPAVFKGLQLLYNYNYCVFQLLLLPEESGAPANVDGAFRHIRQGGSRGGVVGGLSRSSGSSAGSGALVPAAAAGSVVDGPELGVCHGDGELETRSPIDGGVGVAIAADFRSTSH